MKLPFILVSALLTGSWMLPASAQQAPCGKRDELVKALSSRFREEPRGMGLANQSAIIEIFTSKAGTWTILLTKPDGAGCIVSAGEAWEDIPPSQKFTSL